MKIGSIVNNPQAIQSVQQNEQVVLKQSVESKIINEPKISNAISHELKSPKHGSIEDTISRNDDEDVLEQSVKQANQSLKAFDRRIDRAVHEGTKAVIYTITDTKSGQVIAEFPSKKIQDMVAKMWELAGMFVDDKV